MRSAVLIVLLLTIPATAQRKQAVSMTGWYKHANFYQSQDARVLIPNPQTKQMDLAYQFTPDYELALGNQAYQQLVQNGAGVVSDPEVQAYFERLIQKLTTSTPGGPNFPYRITILNAPEVVNAVTPPGHVIVYTGLVNKVESEAELVAVLAHEIAHNYAHHVVRQIGKQAYIQSSINALAGAVQRKSAAVQAITNVGAQFGGGLFLKAYGRYEEKEADLYGTHLMYNAGYNPTAMSRFFLRLYQDRPRQPFKLLSTHPNDPDRANYVSDYLEGFPLDREMTLDSDQFHQIKQRLGFAATSQPQAPPPNIPSNAGPGVTRNSRASASSPRPARFADDPPPQSQSQAPPQIPTPPEIPDPPKVPSTPSRTSNTATRPPAPARPSSPPPTATPVPREAESRGGQTITLDKQALDAFIRSTVPAGASTAGAARDGGIEAVGGDSSGDDRCPPGKCGELRWDGEAKKGLVVTIEGGRASVGDLEGSLPGTPVRVINDMPEDITLLEQPSARNGWRKLTFRLKFDGGFTFVLRWRAL